MIDNNMENFMYLLGPILLLISILITIILIICTIKKIIEFVQFLHELVNKIK